MRSTALGPPARAPVLVSVAAPARPRRGAVVLRPLLVLPLLLILPVVAATAVVVDALGWVAALVRGRLPGFAAGPVGGALRWQTRVLAYGLLLTDRYPPFSGRDADHPVRVTLRPQGIRRRALLLRLPLALPAAVLAVSVVVGTAVATTVAWPVVAVGGRLPRPLHQAGAAVVRYQARLLGYLGLLTNEYPWGLFGDDQAVAPPPWTVWASPPDNPYWRMVLTAAAKNVMVVLVVLGSASVAGANVANAAVRVAALHGDERADTRVQGAYQSLGVAVVDYRARTSRCAGLPQLSCLTGAAGAMASAFVTFDERVAATPVPAGAVAARDVLDGDGGWIARAYLVLAAAPSTSAYARALAGSGLRSWLPRFDGDYRRLARAMVGSS